MPSFSPSPNATFGPTTASGSSHQITGSLILSSSTAFSTLTMLGVQSGSRGGPGSFLALDTSNEVVLSTPAGGGGGGSTDVSDVDDDANYQLVGVAAAGTGVTLTTDDDNPITFNPSTKTVFAPEWGIRGKILIASGSFGGGGNNHGIFSLGDSDTHNVTVMRKYTGGEERLIIQNDQGPLLLTGSGVGMRLASPIKVLDDCSFTFLSDATVDIGNQNNGLRTLYTTDMSASAIKVSGALGGIDYLLDFGGGPVAVTESYGGTITLGAYGAPYIRAKEFSVPVYGMSWDQLDIVHKGGVIYMSGAAGIDFDCAAPVGVASENGLTIVANYMQTELITASLDDEAEYAWTVGEEDGDWLRLDVENDQFIINRCELTLAGVSSGSEAGAGSFLALNAAAQVVLTTPAGGGGGSVAGSDTYVQFNQNGAFAANANFTYDGSGSVDLGYGLNLNGGSALTVKNITYNGSNPQIWTLKDDENAFGSGGPGQNGALLFYTGSGGTDLLKFNTSLDSGSRGVVFPSAFFPGSNDAIDIGDSTWAFRNIYAMSIGIAGDFAVDGTGAGDGGFVLEMPNNKNEGLMIRNSAGGIGNHITLGTTATPRINLSQPTVIGADELLSPKITLDVHYSGSGDPTNLVKTTGGGEVVYFGSGTLPLANNGAVHYLDSSGDWQPANSSTTGSGHNQLLGISLGTYPSSSGMLIKGFYNLSGAVEYLVGAFVKGAPLYIWHDHGDPGTGRLTQSAPTGSDEYVRVVGYATDTPNVIYFNPDATYIELA